MRSFTAATILAAFALASGVSGAMATATGTLKGLTQISFGCPGPVRAEAPTCNPWHAFPHAKFSLSRRSTGGEPVPGTAVVITSNSLGRFRMRLDTGTYLLTPLPRLNSRGGKRVTVRVRAGGVTTALVRFLGYPQME